MPHKNEQLLSQDILFYTYLKTIDIDPGVWKERKLTISITTDFYRINLHELLH